MSSHGHSHPGLDLFTPASPVVALPSWRSPRLLVPAQSAAVRWQTSAFYPAYLPRARLFRLALRALAGTGLLRRRFAPDGSRPLVEHLRSFWPQAEVLAIQLNRSEVVHTWTAQVRAACGSILGYAKGGSVPSATRRLQAEATMLPHVPPGLGPALVWEGQWAGSHLVVTTPVPGRPLPPRAPIPPDLAAFADALAVGPEMPIEAHPWVEQLPRLSVLDDALVHLSGRSWPVVIQHGDCAPWNLVRTPDGLAAFDWECGSTEAMPHLDEAYFILQVDYHIHHRRAADAAARAARYLEGRGLSQTEAEVMVRLAAFDAWRKADLYFPSQPLQNWRRQVWDGE